MKKVFLLILLLAGFAVALSQNLPICTNGQLKCYSDMVPFQGHGPASGLPSSLCPNGCLNDSRRIIIVRIAVPGGEHTPQGTDWGSPTNPYIWNAVNNAIFDWNTATDSAGNHAGYYLVLDQGHQLSGHTDILIEKALQPILAEATQDAPNIPTRQESIRIGESFSGVGGNVTQEVIDAVVKHEIAHELGLANVRWILTGNSEAKWFKEDAKFL